MMGVSIEAPWSLPCMAAVKAPPMKLPPTALDSYVRTIPSECGAPMQEEVCYMSPAKTHRLVWGNQPKYSAAESLIYMEGTEGISRQCAGWVLEEIGPGGEGYEPIYATFLAEGYDCPPKPATYSLNL